MACNSVRTAATCADGPDDCEVQSQGEAGTLYIGHDGTMEAFSSASCGSGNAAQCFTSLATVSYPINS